MGARQGLADSVDSVRDVAMRSGVVLVKQLAMTHAHALMPTLLGALSDTNWRIRMAATSLIGDLLIRISGTKVVGVADGDEEGGVEEAHGSDTGAEAIVSVLGQGTRDEVMAAVYMRRSDSVAVVRQASLQVWKSVVYNTNRALRECLPALMKLSLSMLASPELEQRGEAGRCLGDIVRKLGSRVMPEIMPILRRGLHDELATTRQGVCVGLAEIIGSSSRHLLDEYMPSIIPAVRDALCDPEETVRASAAVAFTTLQRSVGPRAVDDIVPALLSELDTDDAKQSERAMFGMREILVLRSREVMPFLLPKLTASPMSAFNARALAVVAEATGGVLHHYVNQLLPALFSEVVGAKVELGGTTADGGERKEASEAALDEAESARMLASPAASALRAIMIAVQDVGLNWTLTEALKFVSSDSARVRLVGSWLLGEFCTGSPADVDSHVKVIVKELLERVSDSNPCVLEAAMRALQQLTTRMKEDGMQPHIEFVHNCMRSVISDARFRRGASSGGDFVVPGFCTKSGLEALLPMFQKGLLVGTPEVREAAATAIGDMVAVTNEATLKPLLIKITGPLIRIVGDRFAPAVSAAAF